jgi:hypothetical protein
MGPTHAAGHGLSQAQIENEVFRGRDLSKKGSPARTADYALPRAKRSLCRRRNDQSAASACLEDTRKGEQKMDVCIGLRTTSSTGTDDAFEADRFLAMREVTLFRRLCFISRKERSRRDMKALRQNPDLSLIELALPTQNF